MLACFFVCKKTGAKNRRTGGTDDVLKSLFDDSHLSALREREVAAREREATARMMEAEANTVIRDEHSEVWGSGGNWLGMEAPDPRGSV